MKTNGKAKYLAILIVVFVVFQLFCFTIPLPKAFSYNRVKTNLPRALQVVGDEAFSTTALEKLVFGRELQYIGDRAFQNNFNLTDVYIPESVRYIGKFAFSGNTGLVIHGVESSYAQKWADTNCIEFEEKDIWSTARQDYDTTLKRIQLLYWTLVIIDKKVTFSFLEKVKKYVKSMRPQDRPELYPINYRFP